MDPIEVTALDHIYVCVANLDRSVSFYDPIMMLLGFKKGTKPIADEPHVHYYNRVMQYTLRPARAGANADSYAVGAIHHLCFRVANRAAVDDAAQGLRDLGVAASEPRLYEEYRPDYYATFFCDPDGIRLEIVCDTALRRTLRQRWHELDGFEDPLTGLPTVPVAAKPDTQSLLANIPALLPNELIEVLGRGDGVRIERIVSRGHVSPPDFWYDQHEYELVMVFEGAARLAIAGHAPVVMTRGDWIVLAPHVRHRVEWTDPDRDTIWLAVFYR